MDGNAYADYFWHDNPLRFAACGFAVHPVHEPRRENELRHIACLRFFVLGRFLRCGRFDCRCVWGKPDFDFPDCRKFFICIFCDPAVSVATTSSKVTILSGRILAKQPLFFEQTYVLSCSFCL